MFVLFFIANEMANERAIRPRQSHVTGDELMVVHGILLTTPL